MKRKAPTQRKSAIDWSEIHRRLDRAREAIEQGNVLTPEETRKVLKARACRLAQENQEPAMDGEILEVLEFSLGQESYGIETIHIREVCPLKELTPLPCTPTFVLGIISLRGRMVSVIDIKKFFELPERGLTDLNKVIVLHNREMEFGILADAIVGVRSVPLAEIQPSLPTLTGIRREYLKGITSERSVILDGAKLLSDQKIIVHEEPET